MTDWQKIADKVLARVLEEWRKQGHNLSTKVEDTARTTIENTLGLIRITGELLYYARFVNSGLVQSQIPYSPPSGRGGKSKYIEGLIRWATARGIDNPKSAAFAIAFTHKEEGMPTYGSLKFSQTGHRTQFVEDAFRDILPELDELIATETAKELDDNVERVFAQLDGEYMDINFNR